MANPGSGAKVVPTWDGGQGVLGTVSIETHGCKLNQADSEDVARSLAQVGYRVVGPSDPADIYIVNTCTVTHVADSKARQALRSAHRDHPSALVVATGCYAQRAPDELARVTGVGLVAGNSEKDRLVEMVLAARGEHPVACAVGEEPPQLSSGQGWGRSRAMIKIQEGCDQVCAYCIVPKVRGRERSIPPHVLANRVKDRVQEGYKEVVLTGTQLGSYGFDLTAVNLRSLIDLLLRETSVERLRVSSLQPQEISSDLLDLWDDPRLCPHFHVPLQSGSDHILKRMRRRYSSARYAEAVELVRSRVPGVAITADVIVGFPGEEDLHFDESLRFAESMEFAAMHVFPYSVRPGTSAAYMGPRVDARTIRMRMGDMLALAREQASTFRRRSIGTVRRVLWEKPRVHQGEPGYSGLTDNYVRVYARWDTPLLNQITPARLVARKERSSWQR